MKNPKQKSGQRVPQHTSADKIKAIAPAKDLPACPRHNLNEK
jgi:hypothetical protein